MSFRPRRYRGRNWACDIVPKPWYVDVLTFVLVGVWMAWTYSTIQMHGPSFALIGGAVIIAVVGVLAIYGQRLRYLEIGESVRIGLRTPEDFDESEQVQDEREKYR